MNCVLLNWKLSLPKILIDLFLSRFDSIPIIRAIRESEYQITSVSAVYSFLYHTKFSTFGLFRLNLSNTPYGNTDDDITNDVYFLTLVPKEFSLDIEYYSEMADHEVRMDSVAVTARLSWAFSHGVILARNVDQPFHVSLRTATRIDAGLVEVILMSFR